MKGRDTQAVHDAGAHLGQAAYWRAALDDESCTPAERQAFAGWVSRSPERIEAFLRVSLVAQALRGTGMHWPDTPVQELIREALQGNGGVALYPGVTAAPTPSGDPSPVRRLRLLYAGMAAAIVMTGLLMVAFDSQQEYHTRVGEQRSVTLEDGSILRLNTSSAVTVSYDQRRRLVRLKRGEALFQVAHDAARPFDVAAGDVTIRAVGTQFVVDRRADRASRADRVTVTVVEGKVRVSTAPQDGSRQSAAGAAPPAEELAAAQRIVITGARLSAPEALRDTAPVTAWTRLLLVFEDRPIHEVAEEFNRYNRQHILIEPSALKAQRVTGVFHANDPGSFLAFVSGIPGIEVQTTRQGHHVVTSIPDRGDENFHTGGGPN